MRAEMRLSEGEIELLLTGLCKVRESISTRERKKEFAVQSVNSLISRLEKNLKKINRLAVQPITRKELPDCLKKIEFKATGYILFTTHYDDIEQIVQCLSLLEKSNKAERVATALDLAWRIPHRRSEGEVVVDGDIVVRVEEFGRYKRLTIFFDYKSEGEVQK